MGIEELIRKIDREEGKIEGKIEEKEEKNKNFTRNLISNTDFSDEKIAMLVGVDVAYVAQMRAEMV